MSRRLEKINKHIQRTFGEVLQKEADLPVDVLVTITRAEATHNLKSAKIWLSILPAEQREAVLEQIQAQMYDLQGAFNRLLDARPLPRLLLRIDYGPEHAEQIERTLTQLKTPDDTGAASPPSAHS